MRYADGAVEGIGAPPPRSLPAALRRLAFALAAVAGAWSLLAGLFALIAIAQSRDPASAPALAAVSVSLLTLAALGYVAWPSRWNVPAHLQLGFGVTAYVVPLAFGEEFATGIGPTEATYLSLLMTGAVGAVAGCAVGTHLPAPRSGLERASRLIDHNRRGIAQSTMAIVVVSILLLLVAFAVMGFVPAFAENPLQAKFFRGDYQNRSNVSAVLYRLSTASLTLVFPLLAMYTVWRRRLSWLGVLAATTALLVSTLRRGAAIQGLLFFGGIAAASARSRAWIWLYVVGIVFIVGLGSVSYAILRTLGLGAFGHQNISWQTIPTTIAAGAPDVSDQLNFLGHWLADPVMTWGRTFVGGLLPGHFAWNPAVFSLSVISPGVNVNDITSGGLRLPAPLWGFVSFSWPGAAAVSVLTGVVTGVLTSWTRHVLQGSGREILTFVMVVYATALTVLAQFYTLTYTGVLQLLILAAILVGARTRLVDRVRGILPMARRESVDR